jgi:putative zinc finger/helix-turn-helix YgiT family protein
MSKKRCPICGKVALEVRHEPRRYGRGIDVVLMNIEVRHCQACGEELEVIPNIELLHKAIARDLAKSGNRLRAGEIRFLRTYLGYSSSDFSRFMGVSAETVSRWESKGAPKRMALSAERLLRLMVLQDEPIRSYDLEEAGASEEPASQPLRLRVTQDGWVPAAA